jgi:hypothetical protein
VSDFSINNKLNIRGDLKIITRDSSTLKIVSVWEKKNVITFGATESLVRLMAPNAVLGPTVQQENQIKSMRFGTSNVAPQRTDTDLAAEATVGGNPVRIELTDANRLIGAAGTVEFVAVMDSLTGNGVTYREAGLFTRGDNDDPLLSTNGTLFARQVYPDQTKTSAITLEFRWRVTFTV